MAVRVVGSYGSEMVTYLAGDAEEAYRVDGRVQLRAVWGAGCMHACECFGHSVLLTGGPGHHTHGTCKRPLTWTRAATTKAVVVPQVATAVCMFMHLNDSWYMRFIR